MTKSSTAISPAVRSARERNHMILRLRGMYAAFENMSVGNQPIFDSGEIDLGKKIIDQALLRLNAEPESQRQKAWLEKRREAGEI